MLQLRRYTLSRAVVSHRLEARAWARQTRGQQWQLISIRKTNRPGVYRFLWKGPAGTKTWRVCLGVEQSSKFLAFLRDSHREFWATLSYSVDHSHLALQQEEPARTV